MIRVRHNIIVKNKKIIIGIFGMFILLFLSLLRLLQQRILAYAFDQNSNKKKNIYSLHFGMHFTTKLLLFTIDSLSLFDIL